MNDEFDFDVWELACGLHMLNVHKRDDDDDSDLKPIGLLAILHGASACKCTFGTFTTANRLTSSTHIGQGWWW